MVARDGGWFHPPEDAADRAPLSPCPASRRSSCEQGGPAPAGGAPAAPEEASEGHHRLPPGTGPEAPSALPAAGERFRDLLRRKER